MNKKILAMILSLTLVFSFAVFSAAEFGDFAGDNDFGGGDFGGGDFGGGDFGGDYDFDDEYDYDYDNDYDRNNYAGGTVIADDRDSDDDDGGIGSIALSAVIVIIIVIFCLRKMKAGKSGTTAAKPANRGPVAPGAAATDPSTLKPISEYTANDPNFSEKEFNEKLSNLYIRFQNSWTAKDMEDLRPYLSDTLFNQCDRQLDAYRKNKQTNRVDRIAVLGTSITGWTAEGNSDIIVARLKTRIVDYVVDDNSGALVRGSNTAEKFMDYEWTLSRTSGTVTGEHEGTTVQNCPNCGAPVNINSSAKCEYCGSILTTDSFDWVVTNIKAISQRTAG